MARREETLEAVPKPNHFPTQLFCRQHDTAQDRIQPGTIAAAGQDTNPRLHYSLGLGERLPLIDRPAGRGPTIVERPPAGEQRGAFPKTIGTSENHHD